MILVIALLLLAAFVLWVMSFRTAPGAPANGGYLWVNHAAFGCLLLAVAILVYLLRAGLPPLA